MTTSTYHSIWKFENSWSCSEVEWDRPYPNIYNYVIGTCLDAGYPVEWSGQWHLPKIQWDDKTKVTYASSVEEWLCLEISGPKD